MNRIFVNEWGTELLSEITWLYDFKNYGYLQLNRVYAILIGTADNGISLIQWISCTFSFSQVLKILILIITF